MASKLHKQKILYIFEFFCYNMKELYEERKSEIMKRLETLAGVHTHTCTFSELVVKATSLFVVYKKEPKLW